MAEPVIEKVVARNRKAFHQYQILDRYEAGIVLEGTEVKSVREGKVNLKESYAQVKEGEVWLLNCHISPYTHGSFSNHEPLRPRKLLLHRREINRLLGKISRKGVTLVPLSIYFKNGKIKLEIALARGKPLFDKREKARQKAIRRDIEIETKRRRP